MRHEDPRENILNAATKVFAEHGFRDATVRQICAAARTNVSMVNYYFSSKEKLYAEVVNRLFSFVTTIVVSLLTKRPSAEMLAEFDSVRGQM